MTVDWSAVQEHIDHLGLDPDESPVVFAAWARANGEQKGFGKHFTKNGSPISSDVETLLKQRPDASLGLIVNPGGTKKTDITQAVALFTEDDSGTSLEEQMVSWREAGLPEPGLSVFTGNKSIHHYWPLVEPITPDQFTILQRRLQAIMQAAHPGGDADSSLDDPCQVMRVAGAIHPKTGKKAEIKRATGERFSVAELTEVFSAAEEHFNISPSTTTAPDRRNKLAAAPCGNGTHYKDLTAAQRHGVVVDALKHCPERGPEGDGGFPKAQRILAGLVHEFGSGVACDLAAQADWSQDSDWDIAKVAASLEANPPEPGKRSNIWTVLRIAAEEPRDKADPWICPWKELTAQPQAAEVPDVFASIGNDSSTAAVVDEGMPDIRDQFLRDGESLKARLDRGLEQIDALPDVASRSVALQTLRSSLGLSDKSFISLVETLSKAKIPVKSESFEALMSEADASTDDTRVENLLAAGLVLIAAEGFAGKTTLGYQLAESVTLGAKFAEQFQTTQSPALIIQMDESDADAKKKWRRMDLSPAKGQLTVKWQFSPMMIPELRKWIAKSGAKFVVLDSLLTIAGGQISPRDAEFGLFIYRLNELAGELGITILCLHHVVKGNTKRTDVTKEDIYGSAYVYNGASDAWGLWRTTDESTGDPLFHLRCLKARSGIADVGVTYEFNGNDEDRRMSFKGMAGRSITLDELKSAKDRIAAYLEEANGAAFTPATLNVVLRLENAKYAAKLCGELFDRRASTGIDRKKTSSTGGRPGFAYFAVGNRSRIKVEKSLISPKDQSQQGIRVFHPFSTLGEKKEDTFPPFSTTFPPIEESSEREESEGVREDFSTDFLLRAREQTNSTPEDVDPF